MAEILNTFSGMFDKTHTTDSADTSFPSRVPKIAAPSGDGVITLGPGNAPNSLLLLPVGTGANNAVLTGMRVIGWRRLKGNGTTAVDLWIPVLLGEFAAVFGNIPGIANSALGSTYFFMDTITLVTGNANVSHEIVSPVGDICAHIVIDAKGFEKVEITFDLGASATGGNCLYAML